MRKVTEKCTYSAQSCEAQCYNTIFIGYVDELITETIKCVQDKRSKHHHFVTALIDQIKQQQSKSTKVDLRNFIALTFYL